MYNQVFGNIIPFFLLSLMIDLTFKDFFLINESKHLEQTHCATINKDISSCAQSSVVLKHNPNKILVTSTSLPFQVSIQGQLPILRMNLKLHIFYQKIELKILKFTRSKIQNKLDFCDSYQRQCTQACSQNKF